MKEALTELRAVLAPFGDVLDMDQATRSGWPDLLAEFPSLVILEAGQVDTAADFGLASGQARLPVSIWLVQQDASGSERQGDRMRAALQEIAEAVDGGTFSHLQVVERGAVDAAPSNSLQKILRDHHQPAMAGAVHYRPGVLVTVAEFEGEK